MSSRKHAIREAEGGQQRRSAEVNNRGTEKLVPTQRELDAVRRLRGAPKMPKVKVSRSEDRIRLEPDHPIRPVGVALLLESLGTTDQDFLNGLLKELAAFTSVDGELDEGQLNFMLSIVGSIKPQDEVESLLGAHIAAVHTVSMRYAVRLLDTMSMPDRESSEQAFNRSTRTFVALLEALKRYRSGGEQTVTVQHVNVSEGGQAIVGHVTHTQSEAGSKNAAETEPPLLNDAKPVSMPPIRKSRSEIRVAARRRARR